MYHSLVATKRSCRDYTRLSQDHTMCSSTPSSCAIYQNGVISSDRQMIIDSHNKYRAKVARGEESKGLPGPQYSAADMQQLAWNEELAQVAQAWASTCPDYHDCHDCRKLLSSKNTPCIDRPHTMLSFSVCQVDSSYFLKIELQLTGLANLNNHSFLHTW